MPFTKPSSSPNRLLDTLPEEIRELVLLSCDSVELKFGDVVCLPGERVRHVYFPTGSIISLIAAIDGSRGLEVGMVGHEGMFGIGLAPGIHTSPIHALVQGTGSAWRVSTDRFHRLLEDAPSMRQHLDRYFYALLFQVAQTAACTNFHSMENRLARWLLMTRDRACSDEVHLTHDLLSHMLGVRRAGVSEGAASLRREGIISYRRGLITILDGERLEAAACACYSTDKDIYRHFLG